MVRVEIVRAIWAAWAAVILLAAPVVRAQDQASDPSKQAAAAPAGEHVARQVVESLHEVLLGCMKEADQLGFQGRFSRIIESLDQTFDLAFMARTSIGSTWKELDANSRTSWVDLSRRLSASNYASNFDGWSGQSFETLGDEPAAHSTIVVKTELVQPDDKNVKLDYRLRKVDTGWRIIDVQLDGKISEITLRRADYRSVIKRKGFPKLVSDLNEKIRKLAEE